MVSDQFLQQIFIERLISVIQVAKCWDISVLANVRVTLANEGG